MFSKIRKISCLLIFLALIFIESSFGQDSSLSFKAPSPTTASISIPEEYKDLVWNKWDTENFVILSISEQQGIYLKNNIEKIKSSLLASWGIKNFDFSVKCKLVCVSNKEMLENLFKKQDFHLEVRKDSDGDVNANIIWFYLDDSNAMGKLNESVLNICLSELDQKIKVPEFCKVGMCALTQNPNQVKEVLSESGSLSASELINGPEIAKSDSAVLCLMMRKEYGQNNFLNYLFSGDLKKLGFEDADQVNNIFNRYRSNLIKDLNDNLVPLDYLKIYSN